MQLIITSSRIYKYLRFPIILSLLLLAHEPSNAQIPGLGIFFQAVARDQLNNPARETKIFVQSSIVQSTPLGVKVLIEEHQTTTDINGIFGISVGLGKKIGGTANDLTSIDWSKGPYYLNLMIAIEPGFVPYGWNYKDNLYQLGTTQFGTVPYALYSGSSSSSGVDVSSKLNITDTAAMLSNYALKADLIVINNTLAGKIALKDSNRVFVTPSQLAGISSNIDTNRLMNFISSKAPVNSPTFTGTVSGVTKSMVGLANVDNTADADKIISTLTQTALNAKADTAALALKAPVKSPSFTGTVSGITKAMVGLANVDNTADADKIISTLTQTALNAKADTAALALKAPVNSPTFTGTVSGITKAMVGLANVDNTADADKIISSLTQTALNAKADTAALALKAPLNTPVFSGTVTGDGFKKTGGNSNEFLMADGSVSTGSGISTIGAVSDTATASGAFVQSGTLHLSPADTLHAGIITTGSQVFAGDKTFASINATGSITGNAAVSAVIVSDLTINASNASQYNSRVLVCNPTSPITITIDNATSLPTGFNFMVVQKSDDANTISFAGGTGATVINRNSFTTTAGKYALVTLVHIGEGIFVTAGDMQL